MSVFNEFDAAFKDHRKKYEETKSEVLQTIHCLEGELQASLNKWMTEVKKIIYAADVLFADYVQQGQSSLHILEDLTHQMNTMIHAISEFRAKIYLILGQVDGSYALEGAPGQHHPPGQAIVQTNNMTAQNQQQEQHQQREEGNDNNEINHDPNNGSSTITTQMSSNTNDQQEGSVNY